MGTSPYVCCRDGCVIFADDFERTESTNLGCQWDEHSGDWEIKHGTGQHNAEGLLRENGSSGIVINNTPHPVDTPSGTVSVLLINVQVGNIYRVLINVIDENNYYYAEFDAASEAHSWLRVGQCSSGTATPLHSVEVNFQIGDTHSLSVCRSLEQIVGTTDYSTFAWWCVTDNLGRKSGLANASAQIADFDDFGFFEHVLTGGCRVCECECQFHCLPRTLTLTFSASGCCGCLDGVTMQLVVDDNRLPDMIWKGSATLCTWDNCANPGNTDYSFEVECGTNGPTILCNTGSGLGCAVDTGGWSIVCGEFNNDVGRQANSAVCQPLNLTWGVFNCFGSGPPDPPPECNVTLTLTE